MATCHSLTDIRGKLDGESQELKIFEQTGWRLAEIDEENKEEGVKDVFEHIPHAESWFPEDKEN